MNGMQRRKEWTAPRLASVALVPLLAAAAAQALAQDGRQWIGIAEPDSAALLYGTPQSGDIVIGFFCDPDTRDIMVSYHFEPVGAADGMQLDLELASAGRVVMLAATGQRLMIDDGFVLEATTRLGPELRAILTEGETLSVMVQDGTEEIPLAGAADAAAALFETCG